MYSTYFSDIFLDIFLYFQPNGLSRPALVRRAEPDRTDTARKAIESCPRSPCALGLWPVDRIDRCPQTHSSV